MIESSFHKWEDAMKQFLITLGMVLLLAGCGEDGESYVVFYADPSIIGLDPSGIGVSAPNYVQGKKYKASSGTGIVYWTDGISTWWASVNIKSGGDAPLLGILPGVDGKDATTTLYMGPGYYDVYGMASAATLYEHISDMPLYDLKPLTVE